MVKSLAFCFFGKPRLDFFDIIGRIPAQLLGLLKLTQSLVQAILIGINPAEAVPKQRVARGDLPLSHKTAYAIASAFVWVALGSALKYALTGSMPDDLEDTIFVKTGNLNPDGSEERITLPTYAKDIYAWSKNPAKTAQHKLHPIWSTMADTLGNEDFYGTEIRNADDPYMQQLMDVMG